jgi:hypothetical protein
MPPRQTRTIALLAVALLRSVSAVAADGDQVLRGRFLAEAPSGWQRLSDALLHCRGRLTVSVRLVTPEGVKPVAEAGYDEEVSFALNGSGLRLTEAIDSDNRSRVTVGCRNSKYTFWAEGEILGGPTGDRANRKFWHWPDRNPEPTPSSNSWTHDLQAADHVWRIQPLIYAPFAIQDNPLADIVDSKSFELQSVIAAGADQELVEVRFQYQPAREENPWKVAMTLDPGNFWGVRKYHLETEYTKGKSGVLELSLVYGKEAHAETGVRLPVAATALMNAKKQFESGTYERKDLVLKEFELADVPESEFTLAAFGLTERAGGAIPAIRGSRMPLILFNVGAALLLVGIWYLRRRSKKNAPAR